MRIRRNTLALAAACVLAGPALAAGPCEAEIDSTDAMQFTKAQLSVPASCKQFKLTLKHVGKLPKASMGHNWVLAKTADMAGVASDGIAAGLPNDYLKPGDARVIAATKIIGGGESASVSFDVAKLKVGEAYSYFCSFPGHSALMKGTLTLAK
ncbi:azurin [Pseudorhodoferax aquiterrae]|uniref:Azurin n=1 Tax=Pseudorhodoferax aquiterrae TaxID=747304 RepID=A0ABQ3G6U8_9BURK|nr:azurin [Pseudorhodoferax aquiterrae]GHC93946.1 azurin [Pseudorhodoferax aquiterrae]